MAGDLAATATATPKRKLGLVMCVALVVGNMIGSGVFLLPASLAPLGWNSVYGWLVDDRRLALPRRRARCGWRAGAPAAARPIAYPAAAFGPGAGFVVAWSYWISVWVANAAIAIAAVSNLSIVWPGLAAPGVPARGRASACCGCSRWSTAWACATAGGVQVVTTAAQAGAAGRRDPRRPLAARQRIGDASPPTIRVPISAARHRRGGDPRPCSPCSASKARWRRATGSRIRSARSRAPP